jgi:hypothetical protein
MLKYIATYIIYVHVSFGLGSTNIHAGFKSIIRLCMVCQVLATLLQHILGLKILELAM